MKRLLTALILVTLTCSCTEHPTVNNELPPFAPSLSVSVSVSEKSSNNPLEGVQVRVTFLPINDTVSVTTGADGVSTISSIPRGAYSVRVTVDATSGYETSVLNAQLQPGDTRITFALDRLATYTLSGVVSEATPRGQVGIEGVVVDAYVCQAGTNCAVGKEFVVTTDRNGYYSIPGMWARQETGLWFFKTGYTVDGPKPTTPCDLCDRLITASVDTQLDITLVRQ